MNSLWENLYDRFKDRRYGALFLIVALAFIGLLALGAILEASLGGLGLQDSVADALAIAVALMFVWIAGLLWHRRQGRYDRQKFPPLSSDEKRVARSKLVKGRSRETV
jgi:hypothetical protein